MPSLLKIELKNNNDKRLPVAHTCFNQLDIDITGIGTYDQFKERMDLAIRNMIKAGITMR